MTFVRSLLAALPMAALLGALGTERVSVPVLLAGGVAGVAVYVLALLLLGELSSAEVRRAARMLTERLGRRAA